MRIADLRAAVSMRVMRIDGFKFLRDTEPRIFKGTTHVSIKARALGSSRVYQEEDNQLQV